MKRFHIPFEHGAWWSFFSTLLGGALYALFRGAGPATVAGLAMGLSAGFVVQDWVQALLGALLGRKSQAISQWQAWQGWVLSAVAVISLALALQTVPHPLRWMLFLSGLAGAMVLSLGLRVLQSARGRGTLPLAAVLLATPAWAMAALAHGFDSRAWAFFFWPALYYPAVTLVAQAYIRGLPGPWKLSGPFLLAGLAGLALNSAAWVGALGLGVLSLWMATVLHQRWQEQPTGMPSGPSIRRFGLRQAAWGVGLTLLWLVEFLRGPF